MTAHCPFCQSPLVVSVLRAREMAKGTREEFRYAQCGHCGSVYALNFPDDIGRYYENYYSFNADDLGWKRRLFYGVQGLFIRVGMLPLFRTLMKSPPTFLFNGMLLPNAQALLYLAPKLSAKIVDVGGGDGDFVRIMRAFGFRNSIAIDPFWSGENTAYVKKTSINELDEIYDVILFNHSFEHVVDLDAQLQASRRALAKDGTIVIHLPNIHSPEFVRYRDNWWGLHAPYHFALPSHTGMECLARRSGMFVEESICTSRAIHYLASMDYENDVSDMDPNSARIRLVRDKSLVAPSRALAKKYNDDGTGDWIVYYLRNLD